MSHAAEPAPCQQCGACCAAYRVSFYWAEPESRSLPPGLTERRDAHHLCMRGTSQRAPRCAALAGEVGRQVACSVYPQRPSPCRQVQSGDAMCQRARAIHGLAPWPPTQEDSATT